MYLSCGCGKPDDTMGSHANITADKLRVAADTDGITMEQAADNIHNGARQMREAGTGT
jgi:hypothetical protein